MQREVPTLPSHLTAFTTELEQRGAHRQDKKQKSDVLGGGVIEMILHVLTMSA